MKAVVFTLGCKVNECESDSLIKGLADRGYQVSNKLEFADLYIVNTCAVTSEAEKKSRQMASRINKLNPNAKVIFTGCACQKNAKSFTDKNEKYLVTGVFNKNDILDMLDSCGEYIASQNQVYEELLPVNPLSTRTFVKEYLKFNLFNKSDFLEISLIILSHKFEAIKASSKFSNKPISELPKRMRLYSFGISALYKTLQTFFSISKLLKTTQY